MINMVFALNVRLIPSVDVIVVKAMYGTEIIEKLNYEHSGTSTQETVMVMNFLSNVELFHTKMILSFVNFLL